MKLCLPLPKAPGGGSYTFMQNFMHYLSAQGIAWTNDLAAAYDVLFINAWQTTYPTVLKAKQNHPTLRVVHRVDGSAQDYGRFDGADGLQRDVNRLADATIFQSEYSRFSTTQKYPLMKNDGVVIHNPVDVEQYTPKGDRFTLPATDKPRLLTVSWSTNRLKGTWQLPQLAAQNPHLEFVFVGNAPIADAPANLHMMGTLGRDELPKMMRAVDIFLNLSLNDPCPNVVIEALASGLPVVYIQSGGVPELVQSAGMALTDVDTLAECVQQVMQHHQSYAQQARQLALGRYTFDKVFPAYLDVIRQSVRKPLPSRSSHLQGYLTVGTYEWRQQIAKWRRILTGKQSLRKQR